ncbi:RNA ligase-domain-containing protein [Mycena albidolilacea]|uniref:RNA ligase-domain-containing protein n=1 Tax=Mycena albidolilacea TaxID=1033008 RepID=A0AAD6Z2M3_9AGAR|nr:RNA ligase-domain-containing protein [Mycena albidolilacea]
MANTASNTANTTPESDSALVARLHAVSAAKPKLIKSTLHPAPADPRIIVRSWKMDEFRYYDVPSPFPTLARGLFTVEVSGEGEDAKKKEGKKQHRIVARGYDKFFNIGEVPWTTWPALEAHTAPPYTLSLKSNGCIIFIAALTPTRILVTSKHSIGAVPGAKSTTQSTTSAATPGSSQPETLSHAQAGEAWLRKYLAKKGRTEAELAGRLWGEKWTAVAELCDDAFEEHVLPYSPEKTGLHLHGLNTSTSAFCTLPQETVDAFAEEWGFIRTASVVLGSVAEVRAFAERCANEEGGKWEGEAVEGFVVRTCATPRKGEGKRDLKAHPPYPPGSTLFFKIKFDEPYMMYRDWREVTRTLLRIHAKGTEPMSEQSVHKGKMRRPETKVYVRWVIGEIRRDPGSFDEWARGRGIIATRERFLEWLGTKEGQALLATAKEGKMPPPEVGGKEKGEAFEKTIIVPVAVPGCGKTAVSVALAHIFGFGHTQSDDVRAKKPATVFIKNVLGLLAKKGVDVVIADKNNHLTQHRTALRAAVAGRSPPVRLLALNWSLEGIPPATVHAVCASRIAARGENHQSLRPAEGAPREHEQVVWMFINKTEGLAEGEVDAVVEMPIVVGGENGEEPRGEGLEEAVRRAVEGVAGVLELPVPGEEKIREGVEKARGYAAQEKKPTEEKEKEKDKKKKAKGPRYFGLLPDVALDTLLAGPVAQEPSATALFEHLRKEKRVAVRPHVTVVHSKALEGAGAEAGAKELWERCAALDTFQDANKAAVFACTLGHVVWNDRVMAVTVDDVRLESEADGRRAGAEFVSKLPEEVRKRLHITVGTRNASVAPVEGKTLIEAWRAGKTSNGIKSLALDGVSAKAKIQGLFS